MRTNMERNGEGPLAYHQSHQACARLWGVEANKSDTRGISEEVKTLRPRLAFRELC